MPQLLDQLRDEWRYLDSSAKASAALAEWQATDPALAGIEGLGGVVRAIQRRGQPAESDRLLLGLLRRGHADPLAARVVLEAVMPGLKALMRAYRSTGEPEEIATDVIEAAYGRIRCYPCERRPSRVAANLLHDTRQVVWRAARKQRLFRAVTVPLSERLEATLAYPEADHAADEVVDLVVEAVRQGRVEPTGGRIVLLTRVSGARVSELAAEMGLTIGAVRKQRRRAELDLVASGRVA